MWITATFEKERYRTMLYLARAGNSDKENLRKGAAFVHYNDI
jgi:hypothetical protein